ncbi:hypothetical protein B0G75_102242 [Paraburkholderia sp. BL18I3N2]|uniref:hypothetical protein n=1 Tax=Paraburkholderia sp. BL18I3N2 TaxID=1938799 RepID=UPI000D0602F8|nr:hypothetical protein [Paraburkholderia sp. BL18I3N2]PRX34213.1 hypothetical protein B0G75_102242 [Paraburkholderia sp. BL18I3N2]
MGITTARRLAEATSCWLHHEYLCQRAGLFDEAALKGAVGQLLSTFVIDRPARAWSNVIHPALEPFAATGAKPRIDFALAELNGNGMGKLRIAVETKWADSPHCKPANIAYDIYRLALLSHTVRSQHSYECECVFIVAGSKSRLKALLGAPPFQGSPKLPTKQGSDLSIKGKHYDSTRSGAWASYFSEAANKSALPLVAAQGFVDATVTFSPGIPALDLANSGADRSVKFGAFAWTVRGY